MRCRAIKESNETKNVVWFGSYGKNPDGTAKFYNPDKHISYSDKQQAVSDSLTQRLSIIKSELWYNVSYGLQLFDKIKSKAFIDTTIIDIINSHEDVIRIESFSSNIVDKKYNADIKAITSYGVVYIQI